MRLPAVADPREWEPVELALVCVKSFDTADAGRALAPALAPGAVVLSLQNGVENPATLARACPGAAVGGVAVYLGCQRVGRIRSSGGRAATRPRAACATCSRAAARVRPVRPSRRGAAIGVPARVRRRSGRRALDEARRQRRAQHGDGARARPGGAGVRRAARRRTDARARPRGGRGGPRGRGAGGRRRRRGLRRRRPAPPAGGRGLVHPLRPRAGRRLERDALVGTVVRTGERLGVPGAGQPRVRRAAAAAGPAS